LGKQEDGGLGNVFNISHTLDCFAVNIMNI
jgi:hypothetical protein